MRSKQRHHNQLVLYRRRMGLSQKAVSRLLGYRDNTLLSSYENGRGLPTLLTALRLGIILRVPIEFLFGPLYESLRNEIRAQEESVATRGGRS